MIDPVSSPGPAASGSSPGPDGAPATRPSTAAKPAARPAVGWREWVALPELPADPAQAADPLSSPRIKAKVDTGARTSSVHAFDVEIFERDGVDLVRFTLHPRQKSAKRAVLCEAELLGVREVKSSNGHIQERPVILTHAVVCGKRFPLELTLANRDAMGFRMLLGREALRGRFVVDPAQSYLGGRRPKTKR
ncbi:ATP-dependent zinc protease [Alienimonas sp. DA493]|uniref:ATP-dependent zinc protease family protein n=1 Tax=Alienimonas sp. DA493 TaxID=3373605 RepID=UPI003755161C